MTSPGDEEPMVTLRMPLSHWRGIVNGIEKWTGRAPWDETEILTRIEVVEGDPQAVWWSGINETNWNDPVDE